MTDADVTDADVTEPDVTNADVTEPDGAGARVVGPWRAALLVVENHWTWYRRNWRATVISSFLQPVLFLLAMGVGFGSQVQVGEATDGYRYVVFLAPALLVITAVQNTMFESTWAVFSAFKWQRKYLAMVSTPLTSAQVLYGQLLWNALRLAAGAIVFLGIAVALGAITSPSALLAVPFAVLTGMAFSAPAVAYTATREKPDSFNAIFRFLVMPMTLFTGGFYPMSQLPDWIHPLAWITPVWHGIELARGVTFGTLRLLPALGHIAYLCALIALGVLLGRRYFHRRLAV
ncbi:lipooligosaccharide transport system permease protein [Saccharothrix ecbatanensis]|uniref:Transport permease protein n=1 Tax=Saccharothrix ecbatanensis TaxID=1105145 RepID=A0A7W9M5L0_9PSEU|nr:ABC transporter permease [Saccharothrix ecbatanensis]MBB5808240.1 lipooligosaccharide transport system permease protein [Saccharothrix ecbatanensis]